MFMCFIKFKVYASFSLNWFNGVQNFNMADCFALLTHCSSGALYDYNSVGTMRVHN
jgi:hypothetical protein